MFSATDFLPACIIEFMNFEITRFPYLGSGLISRFSALWRRDIGFLLCRHGWVPPGHLCRRYTRPQFVFPAAPERTRVGIANDPTIWVALLHTSNGAAFDSSLPEC